MEEPILADRIAAGALPLDEALDAARDRGIIHLDLKVQASDAQPSLEVLLNWRPAAGR